VNASFENFKALNRESSCCFGFFVAEEDHLFTIRFICGEIQALVPKKFVDLIKRALDRIDGFFNVAMRGKKLQRCARIVNNDELR